MSTMTNRPHRVLVASLLLGGIVAACKKETPPPPQATGSAASQQVAKPEPEKVVIDKARLAAFQPLPDVIESEQNALTDAKITLGRMLYFEKRISLNHDLSCNSCHDLNQFGVDRRGAGNVSLGHRAQVGSRNSPTTYNAALHTAQFWDGRAGTVEEQATMPILNPVEMAMPDQAYVLKVLQSMPEYVAAFKAAFADSKQPVTFENLGKAIGAFERKLVTASRWDKFLKGDEDALTDEEKKGFNTFMDVGCVTCHSGPGVGGNMFQKVGVVKPWPNQKDQGRYEVTKNEADRMMFKVPSLRNIEKTAPYFHDGSSKSLVDAVRMMAEFQLGKTLSDEQANSIVAWLKTLTGEVPAEYIKEPELPKSTPRTPKPNPN